MSSTTINTKHLGTKRLRQDINLQKESRLLDRIKQNTRLRKRQLDALDFLSQQLVELTDSTIPIDQHDVLTNLIHQVREDFDFSACGVMWVNAHQMLELYGVCPQDSQERICLELDRLKDTRAIVRVLQNEKPALKESSVYGEWLVYHAIRTKDHVLGLFIGVLPEQSMIDGVLVKLLDVLLRNSALKLVHLSDSVKFSVSKVHRVDQENFAQCANRMKFISDRDRLTGLANRDNFIHHLDVLISQDSPPNSLAIVSIDFHEFSKVNDTFGHAAGDQVLSEATHRLEAKLADNDLFETIDGSGQREVYLGRIGEDEFGLIISLNKNLEDKDLEGFVQILLEEMGREYTLSGGKMVLANSAGVTRFPEQGFEAGDLLTQAQRARFNARKEGDSSIVFYSQDLIESFPMESATERELSEALTENQIQVWYQPKVDVKSKRIVSAEALVRWQHPEKDLLHPRQFISIAETSGLIHKIGELVLIDACRLVKQADQAGFRSFRVSINLSPVQILGSDIVERFSQILLAESMTADRFELEVSQGLSDNNQKRIAKELHRLSGIGFLISIDDFGMNQASLSILRSVPVDIVKINHTFVQGLQSDGKDKLIVSGLVSMGKSMDVQVLAGGVESQEQLNSVCDLGCDQVQGFHLAKPCGLSEFQDLLTEWDVTAFDH